MAIKVDLDCQKCRKKIKKVLCKIPQIQDQLYDEKNNIVVVKVVCCSPDKVKKIICCKGGKTVKSIEIIKPPPPPKPKPKEAAVPPPKPKPKDAAPPPTKPPVPVVKADPPKPPAPVMVPGCCRECEERRGGGPCWAQYGRPPCIVYGRPVYDSWGGDCYVGYRGGGGCTYGGYDNPSPTCSIM